MAARRMYRDERYENFLEVIEHELDVVASLGEALLAMTKRLDQVMRRHLTFYREMLILVLQDRELEQGFIVDEPENGRAVAELFFRKFGSRIKTPDRQRGGGICGVVSFGCVRGQGLRGNGPDHDWLFGRKPPRPRPK